MSDEILCLMEERRKMKRVAKTSKTEHLFDKGRLNKEPALRDRSSGEKT